MSKKNIEMETMMSNLLDKSQRAGISRVQDDDFDPLESVTGKKSAPGDRARRKAERIENARISHEVVRENRAPIYGRGKGIRRWPASEDYTTSIVFNRPQYLRLTEVAYQRRQSVKELMFDCIEIGLKKLENEK